MRITLQFDYSGSHKVQKECYFIKLSLSLYQTKLMLFSKYSRDNKFQGNVGDVTVIYEELLKSNYICQ